jgi:hypothetical protein
VRHYGRKSLEISKELIDSLGFLNRARKHSKYFTRERKMPFKKLICFLLSMIKESSQNALERYFKKTGEDLYLSRQAFSEARQKLEWEVFRELFEIAAEVPCQGEIERWHGFRLMAIDGTKINLPNDPPLRSSPCAQGSILYDILNDLIVDALIAADERSLAREHLEKLTGMASFGKEPVLFDRGYPSLELMMWLQDKNIDFVMRVRQKFDTGIDALPRRDHQAELEKGGKGPVAVRVFKFRLPSGETETLITSLKGKEYKNRIFKGTVQQ